jgi:hypothetical protein
MSDELELTGALVREAGPAARDTWEAVSGTSVATGIAGLILDRINGRRVRNQIRMLREATDMLEEANLTASAVPHRVLVPLLEFVCREEDEPDGDVDMVSRWAALLANAAAGGTREVPRVFVEFLSQIDPPEALWLDALCDLEEGRTYVVSRGASPYGRESGFQTARLHNLVRLGLVEPQPSQSWGLVVGYWESETKAVPTGTYFHITDLGRSFVGQCRPPVARAANGNAS